MSFQNKLQGIKEIWHFDNRWQLLIARLFFRHELINVYRLKGMNILVDHAAGDANGARETIVSPMYRQFLPRMKLGKAINVLDIGANNGGFPLMLRANGIALKKLASVEFNPNTFTRLRFNVERNIDCEFIGLNAAICGEQRVFELHLGQGSVGDSIYQKAPVNGARLYQIKGMTFDEIYSSSFGEDLVDICKIDVEGAEYEIFDSPNHHKLSLCRYLIIEIHDGYEKNPSEVVDKLARLNFLEQPLGTDTDRDVHFFVNAKMN